MTLVVVDLRGHPEITARLGVPAAEAQLEAAVAAAIGVLRSFDGEGVAVGGRAGQPVVWGEFTRDGHAATALTAAVALRDAVHRAAEDIHVCVGIDSGLVVDTKVGGATPVAYRAMGTLRMFAVRLQEFAGPGQVFVSAAVVAALPPRTANFQAIGPVRTNAGGETSEAYSLISLARPAARPSTSATNATG
jgi:class 3 adenylate cyclase